MSSCSVHLFVGVLFVLHTVLTAYHRSEECRPHGLAKYNLTFIGHWSAEDFPKQYPLFRPNAQWSKLMGRSHSSEYSLFHFGSTASSSLKEFTELGSTQGFDKQDHQGKQGILDMFYTIPIRVGVGAEWATFFTDDNHHLLSFASKIIPSPDWFVGSDSISLCSDNGWLEYKEVELYPIDAGTDKGFTFTSPNWAENPLRPITQITSSFPSHDANSFFYRQLQKLPALARVILQRVELFDKVEGPKKETEDTDDGNTDNTYVIESEDPDDDSADHLHIIEDEKTDKEYRETEIKETQHGKHDAQQEGEDQGKEREHTEDQQNVLEEEETFDDTPDQIVEVETFGKLLDPATETTSTTKADIKTTHIKDTVTSSTVSKNSKLTTDKTTPSVSTDSKASSVQETTTKSTLNMKYANEKVKTTTEDIATTRITETRNKTTVSISSTEKPLNDYVREHILPSKKERRQRRKNKRKNKKRNGKREKKRGKDKRVGKKEKVGKKEPEPEKVKVNCRLGEWAEWSPCSVSCGYGKRSRVREVVQQPRYGGTPCREYPEEELCGTLRTCTQWKHFSFSDWGIQSK